jgi:hypothetical protein
MDTATRLMGIGAASADREADRQMAREFQESAPARALAMGQVQQQLKKENIQWEYTESQRRDMEKTTEAVAYVRGKVSSGEWTPEQGEIAESQLWKKYHSILPLPIYDDSPSAGDIFQKMTYEDPKTGRTFLWDGEGKFTPLDKDVKTIITPEAFSKIHQASISAFTITDDEGNTKIDYEKANVATMQTIALYNQMIAGQQQSMPQQQPPAPSPSAQALPPEQNQFNSEQASNPITDPQAPTELRRDFILRDIKSGGGQVTQPIALEVYTQLAKEQLGEKATPQQVAKLAKQLLIQDGVAQ